MVTNTQVIFSKVPTTYPVVGEHVTVKKSEFDLDAPLAEGEFILKTLVLSVDPYMRGRMRDASTKSYSPPFLIDQPMNGHTMKQVVKSNNADFKVGDLVYGMGNFEEYSKVNAAIAKALGLKVRNDPKTNGIPISNYIGILGMPGMTAYVGLYKIGEIKKGETIYISAASGAVGQVAGQIAKAQGLRVVGSAGSDEKVAYLKEIGFDAAFNYKTEDIDAKLSEYCPNGIDVYFENVGGKMLEIVLTKLNPFSRIIACGMISQYNLEKPEPVHNLVNIVAKRIKFQGFIVSDYPEVEPEFFKTVTQLILDNKIRYQESFAEGIEKTPEALLDVLKGNNFGKQVVNVASL
ncbi:uncharacterized protein BX664DRAFT_318774 [Halteromyces radiatus]|uniref:uncharacterized protein n=1 Tax=Halteromyces radiatus TaxID=101107 RepID=UPI0022208727|nr:uncharacterized protein BX664DRAFT_318774 [Halteromyces radiatus]KAI8098466.1 hypothetical protein BX664DRAFT_318774 [Halteromyces radiatus]